MIEGGDGDNGQKSVPILEINISDERTRTPFVRKISEQEIFWTLELSKNSSK